MKYTVCLNNVVIVRSCFLAGSIWRWQKLYSAVWKWLLSPVYVCLLPELFYWQSFIEVCIYVTQDWLVAVLLIWFQTQVLIAHIFCPTLKSSVLSATFTALPVHYEYKRMYFLNILLIFSHEPIVQVCLSFFCPDFEQTHYCMMWELCIIWVWSWIVWDYLWYILLLHQLYCLHN